MIDDRTAPYGALALRITLGVLALAHGSVKTFVYPLSMTAQYFETLGIPGFFAYLVAVGELGGGVLLLAGVLTRLVAVLQLPILIGATIVCFPNGWAFSNPNGGWEFPATWTVLLVVQALLGDGAFALRPFGRSGLPAFFGAASRSN